MKTYRILIPETFFLYVLLSPVRAIAPRLTIYVSLDGSSYHAIYLLLNTSKELLQKLAKLPGFYELMGHSLPPTAPASCPAAAPTSGTLSAAPTLLIDTSCLPLSSYSSWNMMPANAAAPQPGAFALGGQSVPSHLNAGSALLNGGCLLQDPGGKSCLFISGPSGVHVSVTDEVLNNEILDGSLFALEIHNTKIIMKSINKSCN